jgi:hypothetical protein
MPDSLMDTIGKITVEDLRATPTPGPQLPEEIWQNMPASWAGAAQGEDMGGYILAGGTKYADRAALDLADWQARLRGGDPSILNVIPQEMLDKYWPVTEPPQNAGDNPAGINAAGANPAGASTVGLKYDTSATPAEGDPLGGWFTLAQRIGQVPEFLAAGSDMPSTNNYRLLPPGYNRPGFQMRNGRIIDTNSPGFKVGLQAQNVWRPEGFSGVTTPFYHTAGYPGGFGIVPHAYYGWPGDVDAWGHYGGAEWS